MTRQKFLGLVSSACATLTAGGLGCCAAGSASDAGRRHAPSRPNIVLIVADDLGWNDVSCHGSEIRTPHIDRIVKEGIEFDRFYACPVCSPTRAGLMTGRYGIRFGMQRTVTRPWETWGMPPDETLLPEMLAEAGYKHRAAFGKWHLGHSARKYHPVSQGFTEYYGCYNGMIDYYTHEREDELDWHLGFDASRDEGYATQLITEAAVNFVERRADDGPFFLYVPYTAVHTPNQAPQEYIDRYVHIEREPRRRHAAMTACLDDGIGRILDALDKAGIDEDTLVWFFSDNGGHLRTGSDNGPLRGQKGTVFEGGIRVPAAVRWPGVFEAGRKVEALTGYIDVFPTLQRIVGGQRTAKPLDGVDLRDVLFGKATLRERDWYTYLSMTAGKEKFALHSGEWKLTWHGQSIIDAPRGDGVEIELFKIVEDPYEKNNVADALPEVVERLVEKLARFRALRPKYGVKPGGKPPTGWKAPKEWTFQQQ